MGRRLKPSTNLSVFLDHDVVVVPVADAQDVGGHGVAGTRLGELPLSLSKFFRSRVVLPQPVKKNILKIRLPKRALQLIFPTYGSLL